MSRYGITLLRTVALTLCLISAPAFAIDGPRSNATVSFGAWMTSPSLDRFPNSSPPPTNHHELIPNEVTIKAGGSVNFILGGFHNVAIYDDGTQPTDINTGILVAPTNGGPPLIADPANRIYRGLDPSMQPVDRVEVVHFPEPGRYLVICAVLPHFNQAMYGYVRVLPR
jgi:plastocyanin